MFKKPVVVAVAVNIKGIGSWRQRLLTSGSLWKNGKKRI
jgi:hypothetical protein